MKAIMRGGPLDGQVKEILGIGHSQSILAKRGPDRFIWAHYKWETEPLPDETGYRYVGVLTHYASSRGRCRSDGSNLPLPKKKRR